VTRSRSAHLHPQRCLTAVQLTAASPAKTPSQHPSITTRQTGHAVLQPLEMPFPMQRCSCPSSVPELGCVDVAWWTQLSQQHCPIKPHTHISEACCTARRGFSSWPQPHGPRAAVGSRAQPRMECGEGRGPVVRRRRLHRVQVG